MLIADREPPSKSEWNDGGFASVALRKQGNTPRGFERDDFAKSVGPNAVTINKDTHQSFLSSLGFMAWSMAS